MSRNSRQSGHGTYLAGVLAIVLLLLGTVVFLGFAPKLGLDLQGGLAIILRAEGKPPSESMEQAVTIIRSRIDALGVAEPEVNRQGDDLIVVQLPGITDPEVAERVIGRTARLEFRPVLGIVPPATTETPSPAVTQPEEAEPDREVYFPMKGTSGLQVLHLGPVAASGSDVKSADAQFSGVERGGGGWSVQLGFNDKGRADFAKITGELACNPTGDPKRQLAITLDGVVESAPQMADDVKCNEGIRDGAQITVGSENEAKELALVLRYGSLPVDLTQEAKTQVSPTVGRDALEAGIVAGVIGILLVMLYSLAYYRALGLVIIGGLAVFGGLLYGIISVFGATFNLALTLAGVAGIVVSIGITVDSYVVYFERIKDEAKSGRSVRTSAERAFKKAYRTIIAGDLVSFTAAVILWFLAVGAVRGFAFFLGLATLLDLFIAYFFTRNVVALLARTEAFSGGAFGLGRALPESEYDDRSGR